MPAERQQDKSVCQGGKSKRACAGAAPTSSWLSSPSCRDMCHTRFLTQSSANDLFLLPGMRTTPSWPQPRRIIAPSRPARGGRRHAATPSHSPGKKKEKRACDHPGQGTVRQYSTAGKGRRRGSSLPPTHLCTHRRCTRLGCSASCAGARTGCTREKARAPHRSALAWRGRELCRRCLSASPSLLDLELR